jgi:murein DD-endopeptidase MepM/ murein hydrolase activator NlpD
MRVKQRTGGMWSRCSRSLAGVLVGVAVAGALALSVLPARAGETDPRFEEAQRQAQQAQDDLHDLLQQIEAYNAQREDITTRLAALEQEAAAQGERAAQAGDAASELVRELYIHGGADPSIVVLTSDSPGQAAEQARLLAALASGSVIDLEGAAATHVRTRATADHLAYEMGQLQLRLQSLDAARAEAETMAREKLAAVEVVRDMIEREGGLVPGVVIDGIACPIGQPRSYRDSWGAARSGGRSHKGTDIMAPYGTALYAYESGVVTRMGNGGLGGISLFLNGDSGNRYYYAHLSGYVDGISPGTRVEAGQPIARNGDSGNAAGLPHLHFEVFPGGGGNVNPYPYVQRACG